MTRAIGRIAIRIVSCVALADVAGHALHAQAPRTIADGIFTESQARRGEALYAENCAACHGPDLAGNEIAPPLTAQALGSRWKDKPLGDLFELMRSTMPFNSPGGLSARQNADLLAFILQKGTFPAGNIDLPASVEALKRYRFPAPKP